MDLDLINQQTCGEKFYNQLQIIEAVLISMVSTIAKITKKESEDCFTRLEIEFNQKSMQIFFSYLPGAIIMDLDVTLTFFLKHYVRPFDRKVFSVSEANKFSKLLQLNSLENLYACVKGGFGIRKSTIFSMVSKNMLGEILSFLNYKSLVNVMASCKSLKEFIDKEEMWKAMYYARYGDLLFKLGNLNWKKIYTEQKKDLQPSRALNSTLAKN